jgi:hypothetical protein
VGLLDRLARHACSILDVEQAWILVRDKADPRAMIAVASHGVGGDFTGSRFGIHECVASLVLSTGEAAVSSADPPARPSGTDGLPGPQRRSDTR